jgi:hypothetical protein
MLRPRREKERPSNTFFTKFVFYFGLLMTSIYVMLGLFLIFADKDQLNLAIPDNIKVILGGVLILYGIIRFVRVWQTNSKKKRRKHDE